MRLSLKERPLWETIAFRLTESESGINVETLLLERPRPDHRMRVVEGRKQIIKTMRQEKRDQLLAPYVEESEFGGVRYFRSLPVEVLQQLISEAFVDLEPWNGCPGTEAMFLPFLKRNPQFTAHGYVVSSERGDSRITVEGVERAALLSKPEIIDFAKTFTGADELQLAANYARCWYD